MQTSALHHGPSLSNLPEEPASWTIKPSRSVNDWNAKTTINLTLRVHRSLSWLQRAEQADDADGRFVFLWIAFNAAYATDIDEHYRLSEQETFRAFCASCAIWTTSGKSKLVWSEFSGSIRVLLDNPYVFQSFWDHQNGKITEQQWCERFATGVEHSRHLRNATLPKSSRFCSTGSTPCAIKSCTAVQPGIAVSTDHSCAIVESYSASWCH